MNNSNIKRAWKILCWNIRGINSESRWDAIRSKITESKCDIICLQETTREFFDSQYIRNFCPPSFDSFEVIPSFGASGGSIIIWNNSKFIGSLAFQNEFGQSVEFVCKLTEEHWILTNIYAPCSAEGKASFLDWFQNIEISEDSKWLILGDFNLIRSPANRNKPGGNISEMFAFNEAISKLGLVEIPLKGCKFTWTNKQFDPLLERLDWFFTSCAWANSFPNTWASALSRDTSDHTPCLISAVTSVPKPHIFRFENFWLEHQQFFEVLQHGWNLPTLPMDKAKALSSKFKNLRRVLKAWKNQLPNLSKTIQNCKDFILLLDNLEEHRDLSLEEWNFRLTVSQQLQSLLN
jgi:exonuclease III